MVTAALSNYHPLQYTSDMFNEAVNAIDREERTWIDTALQVGEVILRFLALIPLLFFDALMTVASLIYCDFFLEREVEEIEPEVVNEESEVEVPGPGIENIRPPEPQPLAMDPIQRILNAQDIVLIGDVPIPEAIIEALLTRAGTEAGHYENLPFMRLAVENGLKVLPIESRIASRRIFLEMINNDGVVMEGDAPIEIFGWMATCLIVQYMMGNFYGREPFPATPLYAANYQPMTEGDRASMIEHRETCQRIRQYRRRFLALSRPEKAALIHRLLCPTSQLAMTHRVREIRDGVIGDVGRIHRDGVYNRQVLAPFLRPFKNLIDQSGVLDQ